MTKDELEAQMLLLGGDMHLSLGKIRDFDFGGGYERLWVRTSNPEGSKVWVNGTNVDGRYEEPEKVLEMVINFLVEAPS